jgi:hypothetical protein
MVHAATTDGLDHQRGSALRKLVILFTGLIVLLSLAASLAGALSYGHDRYRAFTTARGETVEVQDAGVYRYSVRALVTGGTPWDFVRLVVGLPLLVVSFVFYLQGSMRGTVLFIGGLASFLYQYLLWTFAWAYNSLFLVYVAIFSLSLWTLVLVLADVDREQVRAAIDERFPVKVAATYSFAVGGLLLIKCIGEIAPTLGSVAMPSGAAGYYTLVDQALDLGLLTPFCVAVGILLLRRESLGYLLSASSLILFLTVGLSVMAGEVIVGLSTGRLNVGGLAAFGAFMAAALALLVMVLTSMKSAKLRACVSETIDA